MKELGHIMLALEKIKEQLRSKGHAQGNLVAEIEQMERQIHALGERFSKRLQPAPRSCIGYCILGAAVGIVLVSIFHALRS